MLSTRATVEVMEVVRELPGLTRPEIVQLVPTRKPHEVSYVLSALVKQGRLTVGEKPRIGTRGPKTLQTFSVCDNPKPKVTVSPKPKLPTPIGLQAEIDRLRAQVAELTQWQTEALARFPDLAVAPVVLEARQIVAGQVDAKRRDEVLAGRKDDCPIMRAVVEALNRKV